MYGKQYRAGVVEWGGACGKLGIKLNTRVDLQLRIYFFVCSVINDI